MRLTRRSRGDERGTLVIALAVTMVLAIMSIAIVARTLSGLRATRQGQDFAAALAQADAGLSDALFRVDQQGSANAATFCVGASPSCVLSSVQGAPGVQYTARRLDDNTYTVLARGTINGQPHAIQATVARPPGPYPYAIWGTTSVTINGNPTRISTSYPPAWTGGSVPANLASAGSHPPSIQGGTIACNGGDPADFEVYYAGGGAAGCPHPVQLTGNYYPMDPTTSCPGPANTPPTPCVPASPIPGTCPIVTGIVTLNPGVYVCYDSQSWAGATVTVAAGTANGGVADIYFFGRNQSAPTFDMTNSVSNVEGRAPNLRTYFTSAYTIDPGNGSHAASFTGVIYAPHATLTSNACKATWVGAILVDAFTCNGAPHFTFQYDASLALLRPAGGWTVSNYSEIPSSNVTLP